MITHIGRATQTVLCKGDIIEIMVENGHYIYGITMEKIVKGARVTMDDNDEVRNITFAEGGIIHNPHLSYAYNMANDLMMPSSNKGLGIKGKILWSGTLDKSYEEHCYDRLSIGYYNEDLVNGEMPKKPNKYLTLIVNFIKNIQNNPKISRVFRTARINYYYNITLRRKKEGKKQKFKYVASFIKNRKKKFGVD